MVVDAGGLWALAQDKGMTGAKAGTLVLTPHPGELALLLGTTAEEVQKDRVGAVRQAARNFDAIVILKGASSLVADAAGRLFINSTGSAALATAGQRRCAGGAGGRPDRAGAEPIGRGGFGRLSPRAGRGAAGQKAGPSGRPCR